MTQATISPKQQSFIRTLLSERVKALEITDVDTYIKEQGIDLLTTKGASAIIDYLKTVPKERNPEHEHLPEGHVIVNKRTGTCVLCGGEVTIGHGFAVAVNGNWQSFHKKGECFNEAQGLLLVDCGYYAVPSISGNNDLDFFVVHIKNSAKEVLRVIGGQPNTRMSFAETKTVVGVLSSLTEDERHEAQALFGREIGRCGKCGRHLTDEASRARGLGSECARN